MSITLRSLAFLALATIAGGVCAEVSFADIAQVLRHPRCLNCHPKDDFPRQGDDRHVHAFRVVRGADDKGAAVMRCDTCHQTANNEASGVPGAPHWQLAPRSMGWDRLSDAQLCRTLLDRKANGDRDLKAIVTHVTNDALVAWAWTPGTTRTPIPVPKAEFVATLERWVAAGAPCPK